MMTNGFLVTGEFEELNEIQMLNIDGGMMSEGTRRLLDYIQSIIECIWFLV